MPTFTVRQEVVTTDGVAVQVEAAVTVRPSLRAVLRRCAVIRAARVALRAELGMHDLEAVLRDDLAPRILAAMQVPGLAVTAVQLVGVTIPEDVRAALATQVMAEQERRATLFRVEAEYAASARLAEAAAVLMAQPGALYLRYLETLGGLTGAALSLPVESPQIPAPTKPAPKPVSPHAERLASAGRTARRRMRQRDRAEGWIGGAAGE